MLSIELRDCLKGEEKINNDSCAICSDGTYNLKAGANCIDCPKGASCSQGLYAKKGYWRLSVICHQCFKYY